MKFRRLSVFALLIPVCLMAQGPKAPPKATKPVRVAFVSSDADMPGTVQAFKALLAERPDLRGIVTLKFLTESVFDDTQATDLTNSDVLVLDTMRQQSLVDRFNSVHKVDLIGSVRRRGNVLAVGNGNMPKEYYTNQGVLWDDRARAFYEHSGFANQLALLKFTLSKAGIQGLDIPDPQPSLDVGYYYPDGKAGQIFATWGEFDAWRSAHAKHKPGALRVAVGFWKSMFYTGDTAMLDAVIAEVERQGAEAIPIFGRSPDAFAFEQTLLDPEGRSRVDVALSFLFRFADFQSSKTLEKLDFPVINMVRLYDRSEQEWRASNTGLSLFEGTWQIAGPELAGLTAPTVVGSKEKVKDPETGLTIVVSQPIASQVSKVVRRGMRYAALRAKPNRDKHVALLYYNYPPAKSNVGASYLNVGNSIANILQRLVKEGYDLGSGADLSPESVLKEITEKSRNVGGYAPGELEEMVAQGSALRLSFSDYKQWLNGYAPGLRAKILKDWGTPEKNRLMTSMGPDGPSLIIPMVRYGNVVLMPQPARGHGDDPVKLYHAKDMAPHHQYVAAYAWLRNGFKADAVVHIGTHGTLEWLDGKELGLSDEDAPDALISDLPDVYIYNVDVVGEGLVAKRRGMATLVDHMVAPFKKGGLYPELAALSGTINDYDISQGKDPQLAEAYANRVREQAIKLGIAKDLSLDLTKPDSLDEDTLHRIESHIVDLKNLDIPYGLHSFGSVPEKELRASTIDAIVSADRSLLPSKAKVLAADMEERILASGPRELDSMVRALRGGFVPAAGGGEPIRNPDSYPTGNNLYGIDPDKIPKPASWELGVKLADQMLADHLKQHGRYPEKVSFVIFGDETMRHEGIMESQIFYLLGTKPVWNDRGKVIDVEVIPSAQLGRPRVDIVIAHLAESMFSNVTLLMDKAVQKVKALEEAENFVRRHYLQTKAVLIQKGYSEQDADKRAGVRIFDEPPGIYELNTATIIASSGTWDSDKSMADEYTRKLGHGFGNGFWGESMEDVFRLALTGTEKVVFSSSTMLYGALDNDDMFMYMGGAAAAVRNIDGATPEMVVTNTRNPGKPEMTSIDKFIGTEFRSRYINPTWIEGMQKEGYAGARAMRQFAEYLWAWDVTVPEVVDDAMWKETFDVYVEDKQKLGMKEFFETKSPFAYQDITARMLETIRKGYWKADAATEKKLLEEYLGSVNAHGVGCAEHTCGNPRLSRYVVEEAKTAGIPVPVLEGFQRAMEKAIGGQISKLAQKAEDFVKQNEAPDQLTQGEMSQGSSSAPQLTGYRMEMTERSQASRQQGATVVSSGNWDALWVTLPILGLLFAWRWRRQAVPDSRS